MQTCLQMEAALLREGCIVRRCDWLRSVEHTGTAEPRVLASLCLAKPATNTSIFVKPAQGLCGKTSPKGQDVATEEHLEVHEATVDTGELASTCPSCPAVHGEGLGQHAKAGYKSSRASVTVTLLLSARIKQIDLHRKQEGWPSSGGGLCVAVTCLWEYTTLTSHKLDSLLVIKDWPFRLCPQGHQKANAFNGLGMTLKTAFIWMLTC